MHHPFIASMCVDITDRSQAPPLYRNVTFISVLSNNIPYTRKFMPRSPISSMSAFGEIVFQRILFVQWSFWHTHMVMCELHPQLPGKKIAQLAELNRLFPIQSMNLGDIFSQWKFCCMLYTFIFLFGMLDYWSCTLTPPRRSCDASTSLSQQQVLLQQKYQSLQQEMVSH